MLEAMTRMVELTHVVLLRYITGKRAWRNTDRTWETPLAREVLKANGIHTAATYNGHRQGALTQWMIQQPIFEVYAQDKGL